MPKVSVIMRCKNSDWVIGQALTALHSQTFKDYELIIVDSGSTDKTLDIIKEFPHKLIKIKAQDYYPGAVLNMACEQAQGEIIVFQNSDTVPLISETLELLLKPFEDENTAATFARQLPRSEAELWVRRDYAISFPDEENAPEWLPYSLPLAAMRKEKWLEQPFYTDSWASEDTDWGYRAREKGWNVQYVKEAIVMHSHNYSFKQLYGRKYVEGEADAWIYGKTPSFLSCLASWIKRSLSESLLYLRHLKLGGAIKAIFRQRIAHIGYHEGLKMGAERRAKGDNDPSKGQIVILENYNDGNISG